MDLVEYILSETAWLYTKIYQNNLFFFDLWSLVHLWSGFMVYLLIRAARIKRPMTVLASILALYEILEILFIYFAFMIFRPETIKDQVTDILMGMVGATASYLFLEAVIKFNIRYSKVIMAFIIFVVSSSYAFFWVGFYHYRYNVEIYNTPGLNLSTFSAWTMGGMFILYIFRLFWKIRFPYRLGLTWLLFFIALLAFEYTYYYILEVRESSGYPLKPLIFGLIHGTRTLHVFYLIAPFILIGVYELGIFLINRSLRIPAITWNPEPSPERVKSFSRAGGNLARTSELAQSGGRNLEPGTWN